MSKNKRVSFTALVVACFIILVVGILIYWINFSSFPVSKKNSDWADFGTYLQIFLTLISIVITSYISYLLFRIQSDFNEKSIKPIIVFEISDSSENFKALKYSWYCVNVGNGPAVNIIIDYSTDSDEKKWDGKVICYSLKSGDKIEIPWIRFPNSILAYYQDSLNSQGYISKCKDDKVSFEKINVEDKVFSEKADRLEDRISELLKTILTPSFELFKRINN